MNELTGKPKFLSKDKAYKLNKSLSAKKSRKQAFAKRVGLSPKTISGFCTRLEFPYQEAEDFIEDLDLRKQIKELKIIVNDVIDKQSDSLKSELNARISSIEIILEERLKDFKE